MTNNSGTADCWRLLGKATMLSLVLCVGVLGCGGGNLAPVKGKVTANGQPVQGGNLTFSPLGGSAEERETGKAATAEVQQDGTYTLGTNKPGDGAKVGKHRVAFTAPEVKVTEEQRANPKFRIPPSPYVGLAPNPSEVEVKAGPNTIDIQLSPAGK